MEKMLGDFSAVGTLKCSQLTRSYWDTFHGTGAHCAPLAKDYFFFAIIIFQDLGLRGDSLKNWSLLVRNGQSTTCIMCIVQASLCPCWSSMTCIYFALYLHLLYIEVNHRPLDNNKCWSYVKKIPGVSKSRYIGISIPVKYSNFSRFYKKLGPFYKKTQMW